MESEIELHSQILKQFFEVNLVDKLEDIENADKLRYSFCLFQIY